jgi:hypothetical protein
MPRFLAVLALVALPLVVLAQGVIPTPDDLGAFINAFLAATVNVKVALGLVAFVWVLRKYAVKDVKFFQTDEGGVILLSLIAFLTTLAGSFYKLQGAITKEWALHVCFVAVAVAAGTGGMWNLIQAYVRVLAPKVIENSTIAKIPFIGSIVTKGAEWLLAMVKSKLDKVINDEKPEPAPVPAPAPVDPSKQ